MGNSAQTWLASKYPGFGRRKMKLKLFWPTECSWGLEGSRGRNHDRLAQSQPSYVKGYAKFLQQIHPGFRNKVFLEPIQYFLNLDIYLHQGADCFNQKKKKRSSNCRSKLCISVKNSRVKKMQEEQGILNGFSWASTYSCTFNPFSFLCFLLNNSQMEISNQEYKKACLDLAFHDRI